MPQFTRRPALLGLAAPLLFVLLQTCIPITVSPDRAVNRVGSLHTVTATMNGGGASDSWSAIFFVFAGPNGGQTSFIDCHGQSLDNCDPTCLQSLDCVLLNCNPNNCTTSGDRPITWTYRSNGEPGRDYIGVCAFNEDILSVITEPPVLADSVGIGAGTQQVSQGQIDATIAQLKAAGCQVVTKDWIGPSPTPTQRPNVGAIFGGVKPPATPTPVPPAAVAATATPAVRPPNTGDAGLRP